LYPPTKEDAGTLEWKFEMVTLFRAGKIHDARKLLCSKLRADEIEEVYRWLYDNIEIFGGDQEQYQAILTLKQGLVDHSMVIDPEINLAAVLIKLARINA
jgi:hypothetical protein